MKLRRWVGRPVVFLSVAALSGAGLSIGFAAPASAAPIVVTTPSQLQTAIYNSLPDPIVLGADITLTNDYLYLYSGYTYTLDLNGHDLDITAPVGLPAIEASVGSSLTIEGTGGGGLVATGGTGSRGTGVTETAPAPGIGGHGGYYNTSSDYYAASGCGTVTIAGGTVLAQGGDFVDPTGNVASAPGIGGGAASAATTGVFASIPSLANSVPGCDLNITGDAVTATAGSVRAPAIGSGSATATYASGESGVPGSMSVPGLGTPVTPGGSAGAHAGSAPVPTVATVPGSSFTMSLAPSSATSAATSVTRVGTLVTLESGNGAPQVVPVVDTRSDAAWSQGRIPGAVHIPNADLASRIAEVAADRDTAIVVYCWGPGCNGSTRGALTLAQLGYRNVRELMGGLEYWAREGLATVSDVGRNRREVDPLTAPLP